MYIYNFTVNDEMNQTWNTTTTLDEINQYILRRFYVLFQLIAITTRIVSYIHSYGYFCSNVSIISKMKPNKYNFNIINLEKLYLIHYQRNKLI